MEPRVGNKFRLGRKIGSGSFGEIYLGLCRLLSLPFGLFLLCCEVLLIVLCFTGTNIQTNEEVAIKLALAAHWQSIVKSLNNYLKMMKANYVSTDSLRIKCKNRENVVWTISSLLHFLSLQVPAFLVRKVFTQIFSFMNVQLFNR